MTTPAAAPSTTPTVDDLLKRLSDENRSEKSPRPANLLNEALDLLEDDDQRIIGIWLSEPDEAVVAQRLGVTIEEAQKRQRAALDRFHERLAWVVTRECRGISPPERKLTGYLKFFSGDTAQAKVKELSLPREVIEIWIREANQIP